MASKFSLSAIDVRPADGNSLTLKALEADLKIHKIMFQKEGEVDDVQILSFLEGIAEYKLKQLDGASYSFRIEAIDGVGAAVIEQKSALALAAPVSPSKTDAIGRENEITAKVTSAAGDLYIVLINQSTEEIIEKKFVVPAAGYSEHIMTIMDGLVNGDAYRVSSYLVTSVGMSAMSQGVTVEVNNIANDLQGSTVQMIADSYDNYEVASSLTITRPADMVDGDGYQLSAQFEQYTIETYKDGFVGKFTPTKRTGLSSVLLSIPESGDIPVPPIAALNAGLCKVTVSASNQYMRSQSIPAKTLSALMWNIKGLSSASAKVALVKKSLSMSIYINGADPTYHPDYRKGGGYGADHTGELPLVDSGSGQLVEMLYKWKTGGGLAISTTVKHVDSSSTMGLSGNYGLHNMLPGTIGRKGLHDYLENEFRLVRTVTAADGSKSTVESGVSASLPRVTTPGAVNQSLTSLYSDEGGKLQLAFSSTAVFEDGASLSAYNVSVGGVSESSESASYTTALASKSGQTTVSLQPLSIDYGDDELVITSIAHDLVYDGKIAGLFVGDYSANLPSLGGDIVATAIGKPSAPASISLSSEDGKIAGQTSYSADQLANGEKDSVKFLFKWVDQNGNDQSNEKTYSTVWNDPTFRIDVQNGVGATAEAWLVQSYNDHAGAAQTVESDRILYDIVTYAMGPPIINSVSASGKNLIVDWHANGATGDLHLTGLALDAKPEHDDGALLKRVKVTSAGRFVTSQTTSFSFASFDSDIKKHLAFIEARDGFAGSNVETNISFA
jgi:hypothetical protein